MAEVDRIVRPGGKLIVRDESNVIREVENMLKSLHWDVHLTFSKHQEGILSAQKGFWRPETSQWKKQANTLNLHLKIAEATSLQYIYHTHYL